MENRFNTKIVLIGSINEGKLPDCGETMKNQLFLKRFRDIFSEVLTVDTYHWKRRPACLAKLLYVLLFKRNHKLIISTSINGRYILKLLRLVPLNNNVFFWVVGGKLPLDIQLGLYDIKDLKGLKKIIVQGNSMVNELNQMGLDNVVYVPNSKPLDYKPKLRHSEKDIFRFVFMSRIHPDKGINEIFDACVLLMKMNVKRSFTVDFYGKISEGFEDDFNRLLENHSNCFYRGYLNLLQHEGYDVLSQYDCMLFPTYWDSEGFPGVVLDSNICGVPIIATDWNLNREVITDINGAIIPVQDCQALAYEMKRFIDEVDVDGMRKGCVSFAIQYDYRKVLNKEQMIKIGII